MEFFSLASKAHMLQHTTLLPRCLSPRAVWCFWGEDMQQRIQRLAMASLKGNTAASSVNKMVRHYRVALHLRFCDHLHHRPEFDETIEILEPDQESDNDTDENYYWDDQDEFNEEDE